MIIPYIVKQLNVFWQVCELWKQLYVEYIYLELRNKWQTIRWIQTCVCTICTYGIISGTLIYTAAVHGDIDISGGIWILILVILVLVCKFSEYAYSVMYHCYCIKTGLCIKPNHIFTFFKRIVRWYDWHMSDWHMSYVTCNIILVPILQVIIMVWGGCGRYP